MSNSWRKTGSSRSGVSGPKRTASINGHAGSSRLPPSQSLCMLGAMSLGQLLMIGVPGPVLDSDTAARFRRVQPGAYIIFGRNIQNPSQLRRLLDDLRDISD